MIETLAATTIMGLSLKGWRTLVGLLVFGLSGAVSIVLGFRDMM